MTVYLTMDKWGSGKYRTDKYSGWNFLPDSAQEMTGIRNFFTEGGKRDEPTFIFTDDSGKEATLYSLKKGKDEGIANLDNSKKIVLSDEDYLPEKEQIAYLQGLSTHETDQEASKLSSDSEILKLYKKTASDDATDGLKTLIQEKKTEEARLKYCEAHAQKYYGSKAVIIQK